MPGLQPEKRTGSNQTGYACLPQKAGYRENVMMPDSVTEIGENAFAECEGLGFICESDNAAAAWASAHQIPCAIGE